VKATLNGTVQFWKNLTYVSNKKADFPLFYLFARLNQNKKGNNKKNVEQLIFAKRKGVYTEEENKIWKNSKWN
jgi:hypothetical protein